MRISRSTYISHPSECIPGAHFSALVTSSSLLVHAQSLKRGREAKAALKESVSHCRDGNKDGLRLAEVFALPWPFDFKSFDLRSDRPGTSVRSQDPKSDRSRGFLGKLDRTSLWQKAKCWDARLGATNQSVSQRADASCEVFEGKLGKKAFSSRLLRLRLHAYCGSPEMASLLSNVHRLAGGGLQQAQLLLLLLWLHPSYPEACGCPARGA